MGYFLPSWQCAAPDLRDQRPRSRIALCGQTANTSGQVELTEMQHGDSVVNPEDGSHTSAGIGGGEGVRSGKDESRIQVRDVMADSIEYDRRTL